MPPIDDPTAPAPRVQRAPGAAVPRPAHQLIITALVFAASALKGLRMPNLWSATHMTFNYSHGFVRRGLFGQVLRLLGGGRVYHYNVLALLAVILFVAVAIVMARFVRRTLDTDGGDVGLWCAVLAFAASPGVVFFAHEIGYLDYVGLLFVMTFVLWSSRTRRRYAMFYAAVPIAVVLALIHESMILMFAPTMLFAMICHVVVQDRAGALSRRGRLAMIAHAAGATLAAFAASSVAGSVGTRSPAVIHALQASVARTANFPLRGDAFEALYRPVRDNLFNLMPWYWSFPANQAYLKTGLVAAAPGIAFLLYYGVRLIGRLGVGRPTRAIMTVALFGATLAPLALNFLGWDSARWNAISLIAAFCCIATARLFFVSALAPRAADPTALRVDGPLTRTLAAAAIIAGLCGTNYTNFLFDGYVVQWFPFEHQLDGLLELFRGGFKFVPRM